MQIVPFLTHYQLVYANFDFSSFSLISYTLKTPFLHYKNHTFKTQQYSYGGAPTILAKCNAHILAQQTRYFCFAKTILCACNALFMGYLETA